MLLYMPIPVLFDVEIQVAKLKRERISDFFQVYWRTHNYELSDAEIRTHLEYRGRSYVVSWVKLGKFFKVYELSRRCVSFMELVDAIKYD